MQVVRRENFQGPARPMMKARVPRAREPQDAELGTQLLPPPFQLASAPPEPNPDEPVAPYTGPTCGQGGEGIRG